MTRSQRPPPGTRAWRRTAREASGVLPDAPLGEEIVAGLAEAVVVADTDRRVLRVNRAAAELFGWTVAQLVGMPLDELFARAERRRVAQRQRRTARGEPQRFDTKALRADGVERDVEVSTAALVRKGAVVGTVAMLRDVTERKRAEDALARSESRYAHLFESASDAIATLDANGRFTSVNRSATAISGYERNELLGRWFAPLLPDDEVPKALAEFQEALHGATGLFETHFHRKDGELRTIQVTYSAPERGEEVLCLIRDVTDLKLLQEQLAQSEKMSAIGQLVSGVAHELNNPLAGISAFAQLLLAEKRFSPEHRSDIESIYAEARRAARIVNNLLTFVRQHKAEKAPTSVNQVLKDTLELRGYELRVRGIAVHAEYDESVPETLADAHQLQQVFLNLVSNAEQAMETGATAHGPHRLMVRTRRLDHRIRIQVEDTGLGIPPNLLKRVFNPFFTTKPTGSGTGLGLSISLGIVRQHDGRIWAENTPAGGARFVIELPIVAAVPAQEAEPARPAARPREHLDILVVEDEASIRRALERHLRDCGHRVEATGSGRDALARLQARAFDAVIVDVRMPDFSGEQLFAELRRRSPAQADRVIFTTGDLVSERIQEFLTTTGRPCVAKPFELTAFDAVLASLERLG